MRTEPTWRIPFGVLLLIIALTAYALVIARYVPELIGGWHAAFQTVVYLILGLVWLLPLKRFLLWMESGSSK
ncbi:DUF2842 domain-containing protein [Erythrobacter sp. SDW2]|uniref:DUF2842 domain-containing protein n=1 Tax=Erythrobacter sp. SDW2 TaxID=2907154 RepID=UPI001F3CC56D|nr:DUF2842 domain-containing protein [Erythrobacter sp. SDW2]UIP05951.1 DUF2842 domain-containing protein [Erythrobacter sp. SDW2]